MFSNHCNNLLQNTRGKLCRHRRCECVYREHAAEKAGRVRCGLTADADDQRVLVSPGRVHRSSMKMRKLNEAVWKAQHAGGGQREKQLKSTKLAAGIERGLQQSCAVGAQEMHQFWDALAVPAPGRRAGDPEGSKKASRGTVGPLCELGLACLGAGRRPKKLFRPWQEASRTEDAEVQIEALDLAGDQRRLWYKAACRCRAGARDWSGAPPLAKLIPKPQSRALGLRGCWLAGRSSTIADFPPTVCCSSGETA